MPDALKKIDARPTKDFFISMLIKDIGTIHAIIDLVDNCVDGAKRLRPKRKFKGLYVRIEATADRFTITDNCGGIPVDLARNYAFRFGRPVDMQPTPHSVGQFGVGMKRALFKLGKKFRIESTTATSHFRVQVDVDSWKAKDEWEFEFDDLVERRRRAPSSETGTSVVVKPLHDTISSSFSLDTFVGQLSKDLQEAHIDSMRRGLTISLNGQALQFRHLMLFQSKRIKPACHKFVLPHEGANVHVRLYAGISESEPAEAGWDVFCNGRLVLGADQTIVTGWGETREETVPKYHNQFARFRGFAFFDSKDASLLPWKTTKTGVDSDSPSYMAVRLQMIKMMRPVIDFLNRLDAEKNRDERPLAAAVEKTELVELDQVRPRPVFSAPAPPPARTVADMGRIVYLKPMSQIKRAQKTLKVKSRRDVGERTFDYFYERECESQ